MPPGWAVQGTLSPRNTPGSTETVGLPTRTDVSVEVVSVAGVQPALTAHTALRAKEATLAHDARIPTDRRARIFAAE